MKDLINQAISSIVASGKAKIILLSVASLTLTAAVPISYLVLRNKNQSPKANVVPDVPSSSASEELIEKLDSNNSFAMKDEFFGKVSSGAPEFNPNLSQNYNTTANNILAKNPSSKILQAKPEVKSNEIFAPQPSKADHKKQLIKDISLQRNSKSDMQVISYDEPDENQGNTLELMTDKDYPKTIASKQYNLDRVLTTDMFIPAVMYTAINSEIPSKTVLAVVESDVSGFHGRNILIPKGSKVEGVFEKLDSKHARRMQISWFKITRPDGIIIKLDSESADSHGASGVTGYLDQRLKDRYGGAFLLSAINALAQMSVREGNVRDLAAAESFGREAGNITAQIVRENINVMPIITIKQGTRFNIRPYQNIYFRESVNSTVTAFFTKN